MGNNNTSSVAAAMEDCREIVKGKFTDGEIGHIHRIFTRAAPSGGMSPVEFKSYIDGLRIFKRVDPTETYAQMFRAYDRDRDGIITFKDFLTYHLGVVYGAEELFDIIFATYDANGDGYLTADEMVRAVTNTTRWMGECDAESEEVQAHIAAEVERLIAFVDRDGDKRIGREELLEVSRRHPEVLEKLKNLA